MAPVAGSRSGRDAARPETTADGLAPNGSVATITNLINGHVMMCALDLLLAFLAVFHWAHVFSKQRVLNRLGGKLL
jgi:hypothetical protein